MKNKVIIFLSAARDLQYVLDLYERHQKNYDVSIICIKLKNIYKYLKSLNLSLEKLLFFPYSEQFKIINPISIFKERKRLQTFYKENLSNTENAKVFFFNIWYDWVLFSFLEKLNNKNELIFLFYATFMPTKGFMPKSLKKLIQLRIFSLITQSKLQYILNNNKYVLFFPYYKYKIKRYYPSLPKEKILLKYSYKIKEESKSPEQKILYLDDFLSKEVVDYLETLKKILYTLQNMGYEIYIKGHPNWECEICQENIFKTIPAYIPMELIDINSFNMITGVSTHSFIDLIKRGAKVISLIDLFDFKSTRTKKHFKKILIDETNNKIKFIDNLDKLCLLKN